MLILPYKTCWEPRFPMDERPLGEGYIANFGITLYVFEFFCFGWFFPFFKTIGFLGILGPPYRGIGATIRSGREMLCLPYAGFFLLGFWHSFSHVLKLISTRHQGCINRISSVSRVEKSCIRETKHLSTNADSSTDTTVGWTKNTQKPEFFEKRKKSSKTKKLKNV